MKTASAPYTRVRLMMTSMSYSRYLSTATPIAVGTDSTAAVTTTPMIAVASGPGGAPTLGRKLMKMRTTDRNRAAEATHLIWWRLSASAPRRRRKSDTRTTNPNALYVTFH